MWGEALSSSMDRSCTEAGGQPVGLSSRRASQAVGREPAERLEPFFFPLWINPFLHDAIWSCKEAELFAQAWEGRPPLHIYTLVWVQGEGSLVEAWPGDRLLRQL